jgi:chloramphenicol-sensitive protein RarD
LTAEVLSPFNQGSAGVDETGKGILALLCACLIWGLAPIYFRALGAIPASEIMAHRVCWSFMLFGTVLAVQGRWGALRRLLGSRRGLGLTALAAALVSFNWYLFIWAIGEGRALEASLGYYIFPLMAVLVGSLAFGERLDRPSWVAVGLAVAAVLVLSAGLGAVPWISLALASSFAIYGILKKLLAIGPVVSVTGEVLLIAPLALVWIVGAETRGWDGAEGAFTSDPVTALLLIFAGPLTAGPLILFSYAARRVSYGTLGVIQYLNPSMQFAVAVLLFGEPLSPWHAVALPLIWLALAIYSAAALARDRAARNAARVAGTSGRAVM